MAWYCYLTNLAGDRLTTLSGELIGVPCDAGEPIPPQPLPLGLGDIDKGNPYQRVMVDLGPTIGNELVFVRPSRDVLNTATPVYVGTADCDILVNVNEFVIVNLPDVRDWVQETQYRMKSSVKRPIFVKDLGYHASTGNILVAPFGDQVIDGLPFFTIVTDGELIRLYPLNDLSGWFVG